MTLTLSAVACTASTLAIPAFADDEQTSPTRPPSVPLVTSDPYFSIWSSADTLTEKPTTHWTGRAHRLSSLVRIDGKTYRLMGEAPDDVPAMNQSAQKVRPTQTIYTFEDGGVELTLTFTSPMLPDDLDVLSRPITYLTWSARATDGKEHDVAVYFDAAAEIAVNSLDQQVVSERQTVGKLNVLKVGTQEQPVLRARGDDRRIDWGYFYVAADSDASTATIGEAEKLRNAFGNGKKLPAGAQLTDKAVPAEDAPVLAIAMPLGKVDDEPTERHVILAYDDEYSIKYFREQLRPYWRKDGATAADLLKKAAADYESLRQRCDAFDAELVADLKKIGGDGYAQIGSLAWRQALAAQKICADENGQPLSFSKENFSNGCIATVDVLYPASPQMMVFAPSLLKASLVPLLDYSSSPRWKHDSAPHDLGQYPHATGQVYGGEENSPMPVEETGNMLIMLGALSKVEGNADFANKYWPLLTTWANFLKKNGLDPENQLTTDDFAGHIARNANLSVKAIMGIAAYGEMAKMLGKDEVAKQSMQTAREYAQKWMEMADEGDHYKLVFGDAGNGTWSQKYNLVWDKLLDLNVFPPEVAQKEMAYYKTKMNKYGLPLDSRKSYTKLDWEYWTATLAEDDADFRMISDACAKWANETPARVPLSDWYETDTGKQSGFQARSVVGGVFIGLMRDREIWSKYANRDNAELGGWAELPWKLPPMRHLVPTAEQTPVTWKFTTAEPGERWMESSFDDGDWKSGTSGFGTRETPGAIVRTNWETSQIFLRRDFELPEGKLNDLQLLMHHDEDADVYINGELATRASGFQTGYTPFPISEKARASLKPGRNVLAVHCRQRTGGQYIDVGLVDILPMPKK